MRQSVAGARSDDVVCVSIQLLCDLSSMPLGLCPLDIKLAPGGGKDRLSVPQVPLMGATFSAVRVDEHLDPLVPL